MQEDIIPVALDMIGQSYGYMNPLDNRLAILVIMAILMIGMICLFGVILAIQEILIMPKNQRFSRDIHLMILMAMIMAVKNLKLRIVILIMVILEALLLLGGITGLILVL